jgi:curved DNA-binding protein
MTDYYKILGVGRDATQEDIKKAYRSLAMKHHPDRGGDEKKFKEIEEAYRTLSDSQTKSQYDNPNSYGQGNVNEEMFDHFFRNPFGFGAGFGQRGPKNPNINVTIDVTLEDAFRGKTIDAEIGLTNGGTKLVSINIPQGVETGMQIKYSGMGETLHPKLQAGDLIVSIRVLRHHMWERHGDNLLFEKTISVWEALLGTSLTLVTIDGKTLSINIPSGTQPDTMLSCKGEGMPNVKTGRRGNLVIRVKITVPKNLSTDDIDKIKRLRNELSIRSS